MEILDPDLWNDDGTPKRPSQQYMKRLEEAQDLEAVDPATPAKREAELKDAYLNYARIKREARSARSPEIGDIVHFWNDATCYAAIVMEAESFGDGVCLRAHVPHKPFEDWQAPHDEDKEFEQTYHWPCGEGQ